MTKLAKNQLNQSGNKNWIYGFIVFTIIYLSWFYLVVGLETKNWIFLVAIFICLFVIPSLRASIAALSPLFVFLILYDSLRILPYYNTFEIHNKDLFLIEQSWFSFNGSTLSEYFLTHHHSFLDFLGGISYLTWFPFPAGFALFLLYKKRYTLTFRFLAGFLVTNLIGFVFYITYPAAPPWYYLEYGEDIIRSTKGSAAALVRFDELVGLPIYKSLYANNGYIFGAIPSLHCAYPMVLSYYSFKYGNKYLSALFVLSVLLIWFTAVYSLHHYIVDVLLGIACAIAGIFINEQLFKKTKVGDKVAQAFLLV